MANTSSRTLRLLSLLQSHRRVPARPPGGASLPPPLVVDDDEEAGVDACRFRTTGETLDWPAMALGMFGAELEVLGPPELTE